MASQNMYDDPKQMQQQPQQAQLQQAQQAQLQQAQQAQQAQLQQAQLQLSQQAQQGQLQQGYDSQFMQQAQASPSSQPSQPKRRTQEYSFWDRMNIKKSEVIKLALFSLVIVLGISIDRIGTHYILKYVSENVLTDMQEFLLRLCYPIIVFLLLWVLKSA
jgi:uncharacterized membrane protein